MASLSAVRKAKARRESVRVEILPADALEAQLALLDRPWSAEEGPLHARFRRREGAVDPPLSRGIAFDVERTVTWDEDGVEVISAAEPDNRVVALTSTVVVREKLQSAEIPAVVQRVDYLEAGVWFAARYFVEGETNHAGS